MIGSGQARRHGHSKGTATLLSQCRRDHLVPAIIREEAQMGLLDVLNGMQNGPRGQQDPNAKGGMSPITMAILALLAYKGIKHVAGSSAQQAPAPSRLPG